jgi:hypothetical protein
LITHHPPSASTSVSKAAPLRTSDLVSVDLLDVLDRLALQVLGVDLLRRGIGLDDGLGFGLRWDEGMSELNAVEVVMCCGCSRIDHDRDLGGKRGRRVRDVKREAG